MFTADAQGREKDQGLMRGSAEMPLPAFLPLDYNAGRARAWLAALEQASSFLPPQALGRLWDMDCDTDTGRLALASLLFPVEAATPDISASRNIEVFLEDVKDPSSRATQILDVPDLFLLQMSLLADMRNILKKIQEFRPESMALAESSAAGLDPLASALDEIWNISRSLQKGESLEGALDLGTQEGGQYLAGMIRACEKRLEAQENQAALAIIEDALIKLEQTEKDNNYEVLKKYLQGRLLRLRGLAHGRQNQLALAEKDLSRAVNLLSETGLPLELRGETYLELGTLRKTRRDIVGMCAAYRNACALGHCASLAASRRQGFCMENSRP